MDQLGGLWRNGVRWRDLVFQVEQQVPSRPAQRVFGANPPTSGAGGKASAGDRDTREADINEKPAQR